MSKGLKLFLLGSVFVGIFCLSNEVSARIPVNQYRQDGYSNRDGWNSGDYYSHDQWRGDGGWQGAPVGGQVYGDFGYQGGPDGYPGAPGNYPAGGEIGAGFNGPGGEYGGGAGFNNPYQGDGAPVDGGFQMGQEQPLSPNSYPQ